MRRIGELLARIPTQRIKTNNQASARTFAGISSWVGRRIDGFHADGRGCCTVLHFEYLGMARCPSRDYSKCEHDCDRHETRGETRQEGVGTVEKAKN